MEVKIRPMKAEDIRRVFGIAQECGLGSWSLESYKNECANPVARYLVAEIWGEVMGFAGIWCVVDEAQIMNIGVLEGSRLKGLGSKLMKALMQVAVKEGCSCMTLEVKQTNAPAICLYQKMGFKAVNTRINYYPNNESALMMRRDDLE